MSSAISFIATLTDSGNPSRSSTFAIVVVAAAALLAVTSVLASVEAEQAFVARHHPWDPRGIGEP